MARVRIRYRARDRVRIRIGWRARERSSTARIRPWVRRAGGLIRIKSSVRTGNRVKIGGRGCAGGNGDDPAPAVDDGGAAGAEEGPLDAAEGDARGGAAGFALSRCDPNSERRDMSSATRTAAAAATDATTATGHLSQNGLGFNSGGWGIAGREVCVPALTRVGRGEGSWASRLRGGSPSTCRCLIFRDNAVEFWTNGYPRR